MFAWGPGVAPVTLLFPRAVLWVSVMSQYANFVGHLSSLMGALARQEAAD